MRENWGARGGEGRGQKSSDTSVRVRSRLGREGVRLLDDTSTIIRRRGRLGGRGVRFDRED